MVRAFFIDSSNPFFFRFVKEVLSCLEGGVEGSCRAEKRF